MSAEQPKTPVCYRSVYHHGVDEKRRIQIPAKWRVSEAEELTLLVWPKGTLTDACLMVLPPAEWEAWVQKLKVMPYSDAKAQALRHALGTRSDSVTLDKAGRICLPEAMAKAVAIEKEAVLVGLVNWFQIWNPERYQTSSLVDGEMLFEAIKLL